jgi:beta-galactosidase
MGLLMDPKHPVFALFPTEQHSNWQWMDIALKSYAFILDGTPAAFRPLVQVVPDFNSNHKTGVMLETRVGSGWLFACSADIENNLDTRHAARQLRQSIFSYIASEKFNPQDSLSSATLDFIFQHSRIGDFVTSSPPELAHASLHVIAGAKAQTDKGEKWSRTKDEIVKSTAGTSYQVGGRVWKDSVSTSWTGSNIEVNVTVPVGFTGMLYARFHDWNNRGRSAHITFEGESIGILGKHDEAPGKWLGFNVNSENSKDGSVQLKAQVQNGPNVMISELSLVPAQ